MTGKVTDLEEFALAQVMRPYWPLFVEQAGSALLRTYGIDVAFPDKTYPRLVHTVDQVAQLLDVGPLEWRMAVFDRLSHCNFWFPDYIDHKIVHVVRAGMAMATANSSETDTPVNA